MHRRRYQGKLVPAEEKFPSEDEKFLLDHQESHHNVLHLHSKSLYYYFYYFSTDFSPV